MYRKIKLHYWNDNKINFGDQLSPYIIKKISGKNIQYKHGYYGLKDCIKKTICLISEGQWSELKKIHYPYEKVIIGVGSIIYSSVPGCIVWGSGFMNYKEKFNGGKITLVRGPYTREKLLKEGIQCPEKYGDPAILLPIIYNPPKTIKNKIGIIPHWRETSFFKKYSSKYKIIDLNTKQIEETIDDILSCEYILSTSLHGLIVAHTYGIPALWIKKGYIDTDGFKFADYFGSVGINQYEGLTDLSILESEEAILVTFDKFKNLSLPQKNLSIIRKTILETAPFDIII